MPASAGDVYAGAETLLAVASAALDDTVGGPIAYQAITQGPPSFDCPPALYVTVASVQPADTAPGGLGVLHRIDQLGQLAIVTYFVTVIRCVPTIQQGIKFPNPADLSASAAECYSDLWAIWNWVTRAHKQQILFGSPSFHREFAVDPAIAVLTSGAAGGWQIPIRAWLGGYAPDPEAALPDLVVGYP